MQPIKELLFLERAKHAPNASFRGVLANLQIVQTSGTSNLRGCFALFAEDFAFKRDAFCVKMVVAKGAEAMQHVLGWDKVRTSTLLQDCESELKRRLQQIQAVQSMRGNMAQRDSSLPPNDKNDKESKAAPPQRGK